MFDRSGIRQRLTNLRDAIPATHPDGVKFIAVFFVVTVFLAFWWWPLGIVGALLTLWCIAFFRDPVRVVPASIGLVVSPADGVVCAVGRSKPPAELEMGSQPKPRVCVFMNVFNVHVNRAPISGKVSRTHRHAGAFLNAAFDKASDVNERVSTRLETDFGAVGVVQIAGLVARRIRCLVALNQELATGERIGLIRFGSRVDIYLPESVEIRVGKGQHVRAGETVIGWFPEIGGKSPGTRPLSFARI